MIAKTFRKKMNLYTCAKTTIILACMLIGNTQTCSSSEVDESEGNILIGMFINMFSNIFTARDIDGTIQSSLCDNNEINSKEYSENSNKNSYSTKISTDYKDLQPSNYTTS